MLHLHFESIDKYNKIELDQGNFISLLAKHKALILRNKEDKDVFKTNDFAIIVLNLALKYYLYVWGAAPKIIIPIKAGDNLVYIVSK